jgi:hypothetical protein
MADVVNCSRNVVPELTFSTLYCQQTTISFTYDHRTLKTRLPVRSALFKQRTGGLVVRWVTTSEYPLLYVFCFLLHPHELAVTWLMLSFASSTDTKREAFLDFATCLNYDHIEFTKLDSLATYSDNGCSHVPVFGTHFAGRSELSLLQAAFS